MSERFDTQKTSQGADTQPPCELGDDGNNVESNEHPPTLRCNEDEDKVVPAHDIARNARGLDDDKRDRGEGIPQPVEVNDGQGAPTDDRLVVEQPPTPDALEQPKKVMPDEVKRIALDLHAKGKSPKQIAAHYRVSEYGLAERDVADFIQEQKGTDDVSDLLKSLHSKVQFF
jgi:hypothetical protein